MMQIPPGFNVTLLIQDYLSWSTLFISCAAIITAYYLYKKVVRSL